MWTAFPEPNSLRLTSERLEFLPRHKDYTSTPSRIIMMSRLSHSLPTAAGLSNTAKVGGIGDCERNASDPLGDGPRFDVNCFTATHARVAELADALDSKSSVLNGREGSSPSSGTYNSSTQVVSLQSLSSDTLGACCVSWPPSPAPSRPT